MPLTRGQRLRRLRDQKGVEQKEAAPAMGISRPYLSLLERDEKGRNIDHLRTTFDKAARYYGVIPQYLLAETPQAYVEAFVEEVGPAAPHVPGQRLALVLEELQLRWGDEFALPRVAEAMGMSVGALEDFLAGRAQITETVAEQFMVVIGVPVEWLVPRPVAEAGVAPEVKRIVEMAMANGVQPSELEMLIQAWLVAKKTKTPSGL